MRKRKLLWALSISLLEIVKYAYLLDKGKIVARDYPQDLLRQGVLEKVSMGK